MDGVVVASFVSQGETVGKLIYQDGRLEFHGCDLGASADAFMDCLTEAVTFAINDDLWAAHEAGRKEIMEELSKAGLN